LLILVNRKRQQTTAGVLSGGLEARLQILVAVIHNLQLPKITGDLWRFLSACAPAAAPAPAAPAPTQAPAPAAKAPEPTKAPEPAKAAAPAAAGKEARKQG